MEQQWLGDDPASAVTEAQLATMRELAASVAAPDEGDRTSALPEKPETGTAVTEDQAARDVSDAPQAWSPAPKTAPKQPEAES